MDGVNHQPIEFTTTGGKLRYDTDKQIRTALGNEPVVASRVRIIVEGASPRRGLFLITKIMAPTNRRSSTRIMSRDIEIRRFFASFSNYKLSIGRTFLMQFLKTGQSPATAAAKRI